MNPIYFPRHRKMLFAPLGPTSYVGKHAAWELIINPTPEQVRVMFTDDEPEAS